MVGTNVEAWRKGVCFSKHPKCSMRNEFHPVILNWCSLILWQSARGSNFFQLETSSDEFVRDMYTAVLKKIFESFGKKFNDARSIHQGSNLNILHRLALPEWYGDRCCENGVLEIATSHPTVSLCAGAWNACMIPSPEVVKGSLGC